MPFAWFTSKSGVPVTGSASGSVVRYRVPLTVVLTSKSLSWQMPGCVGPWSPAQTQWPFRCTSGYSGKIVQSNGVPSGFVGHFTLISNSVLGTTPWSVVVRVNILYLGNTSTLPGCSESFSSEFSSDHVATDTPGHAATGAATAIFRSTSLTPGTPATGTRGDAATGAATPILSDTSNKLLSVFILHAPFLIGPVRDRLCGAIGFPKCHLRAAGPTASS